MSAGYVRERIIFAHVGAVLRAVLCCVQGAGVWREWWSGRQHFGAPYVAAAACRTAQQ